MRKAEGFHWATLEKKEDSTPVKKAPAKAEGEQARGRGGGKEEQVAHGGHSSTIDLMQRPHRMCWSLKLNNYYPYGMCVGGGSCQC